jgi:predicted Ser/Thr protein kinase
MGPCLSLFKVPFSNGVDVNDSVWMSYDANNSSLPNQKRISKLESLQHFFTTGSNISFIDKYICSSKVLGKGGFSVVFEGYFLDSDDMVAVKKISKAKVVDVTRLKLEVKILRSMNHNNIMGFYDFFEEPLNYILVTELLIGGDLATRLSSKNNYNEKDARDLMVTLIETVRFIHQQDVVHRDLKV